MLLIATAAHVAFNSASDADELFSSLNVKDPVLAQLPPTAEAPRPTALTRRVVLLVIDGLGEPHSHQLPALETLRRVGVSTVASSHLPSLSRPNYVSILTGVPPENSGVRSNDYGWEVPLDSLLHRVLASGRQTAFATDRSPGFGAMFAHQLSEGVTTPWSGGLSRAGLLALDRRYPLVVLIPGAVDNAGHRHGGASNEYRAAALAIDRQLGDLLGELDLTRDTIVVTSDHGHTARGGHGGAEPEVMQVPLVMAGAGIRAGASLRGARLIDLAPTLAALLGTATPRHALGRPLVEALMLSPPQARDLFAAEQRRQQGLHQFLREHPASEARPLLDRMFATIALALLLLFVVVTARRSQLIHCDRWTIAVGVAGALNAVATLLLSSGADLSLSALPNRSSGTQSIMLAAGIATCLNVGGSLWALRGRPSQQRLAGANAIALIGLCVAMLLVNVARSLTGSPPWLSLPPEPMLLLLPLLHMALATYALSSGLALALELVVLGARLGTHEPPRYPATS
jgi:hypothetical protein